MSTTLSALPGVDSIDTPALVVDLDAMERNIATMAAFCRQHQIAWRPHAKLHKSAELAQLLVQAGAVGACVQKTAEAEALVAGGVTDVYTSNEVVALPKLERIARMARSLQAQNGQIAIAVDSLEGIHRLAAALDVVGASMRVFVEIDVGQNRCGVQPGAPAVALAQEVLRHPCLRFAGLQAYHGKAQHLRSADARRDAIAAVVAAVQHTRQLLEAAGIPVPLVTGAGTGSFIHEAASGVYDELQPGSFLFMDADYAANESDPAAPVFEHALFVKTQVISVCSTHAVCDAGHKSHAIDSGLPRVWNSALEYGNGGDEHGILRGPVLPAIGDTLWLVPGHCDPTVNLYDHLVGVRGGLQHGVVERHIRVDARGALT